MKMLQKQTLVDQAVTSLMDYIHANRLQPGAVLPGELQLAGSLGVSRPVVREALRTLHGRAVVNLVSGKGAVLRPLDGKVLDDFFDRALANTDLERGLMMEEARHGLETQCASLAATRRTAAQLRQLEQIVEAMSRSIRDKAAYWQHNLAFHRVIAKASGNTMLSLLVISLQDAMDRVFQDLGEKILADRLWPEMHPFHERILHHIGNRDAKQAAAATAEHLELAMQIMRRKR